MTDGTNALSFHDYLPFGQEAMAGMDGRGSLYDGADPHVKFTGKLRGDSSESGEPSEGLDYFGARYFSAAQGRWTSPDPIVHPGQSQLREEDFLSDPQRWNKYAYALNNPLRYTDPDGAEVLNYSGPTVKSPAESPGAHPRAGDAAMMIAGAGGVGLAAYSGPGELWAIGRGLLAWALGHPTQVQQTAATVADALAPPGTPSVTSTFGFAKIEGTIEGFTSGRLANGAEVAAQFAQNGSNTTVSVLGAFNAAGPKSFAGTVGAIEAGAQAVAKSQGATSLTLQAVAVTNPKLAAFLVKQGFKETTIKVGKEVVKAYEKTVEVR